MNAALLRRWVAWLGASALVVASALVRAEDIDIYGLPPDTGDLPNILFLIDNSANWGADVTSAGNCSRWPDDGTAIPNYDSTKKSGAQLCALVLVVERLAARAAANGGLPVARMGVMLFNSGSSKIGAYPRIAFTAVTPSNKNELQRKIKSITGSGGTDTSAAAPQVGLGMYEAHLWFKGEPPQYGLDTPSYDPNAFVSGTSRYNSPAAASCGRNFIIFISNGDPGTQTQVVDAELSFLRSVSSNTTAIPPPAGVNNPTRNLFQSWGDEYARELLNKDFSNRDGTQSITTFAVGVIGANSDPKNSTTPPFDGFFAYLDYMARFGGSPRYQNGLSEPMYFYPALGPGAIADAIDRAFDRILSANTVFTSAALPISVSTQGTYKNQVFIGMFRPDELMRPRWYGNLKQYRFAYDDVANVLSLVDSAGNAAVSPVTGYVEPSAASYWSSPSTFWVNSPRGTVNPTSDSPDGEVAEKGGAGQRQREAFATGTAGRKVYTCIDCAPNTALSVDVSAQFTTGNGAITASDLGVSSSSERDYLINWIRGTNSADNFAGEDAGPTTSPATTVRPSIQGDVLHSRPAVIDYGGSTGVVVFYGSNDGMLRAVSGEQTGANAGRELWSFVPREMFGKFRRLRNNWPEVKFLSNPDSSATPRDYFVDGPITVLRNSSTGESIIYVAMRRGGRFLYAFDVTTPTAPRFKWRFGRDQFDDLGQTWSEPRLAMLKGYSNPVIVMGAGYDRSAEDSSPPEDTTRGNAVLVIDAYSGALVRSLPTSGSVPGAVTLIDIDSDGFTDRAYLGDTRANVYRVDFEDGSTSSGPSTWAITKLAALAVSNAERKFLFEPDVVVTKNTIAILLGSGDREKPLLGRMPYTGTDRTDTRDGLFTLFDPKRTKGAPTIAYPIRTVDLVTHGSYAVTENPKGCFFPLPYSAIGEKVVNAGLTVAGRTLFSTNTPTVTTGSQCGNLGTARTYAIPLFCGEVASTDLLNGGLPPTPVTGLVDLGGGVIQRFLIGGAPPTGGYTGSRSSIGASKPAVAVDNTRRRTYWHPNRSR
jgi:type IV pilus assembly protein PilY1